MNNDAKSADLSFKFSQVMPGVPAGTCTVYDVNARKSLGRLTGGYSAKAVAAHDAVFVTLAGCS